MTYGLARGRNGGLFGQAPRLAGISHDRVEGENLLPEDMVDGERVPYFQQGSRINSYGTRESRAIHNGIKRGTLANGIKRDMRYGLARPAEVVYAETDELI